MTDIKMLQEKVKQSGLRTAFIAKKVGLTPQGLYNKLNGKYEFNVSEMQNLSKLLRLSDAENMAIFFADNVDKSSTQ